MALSNVNVADVKFKFGGVVFGCAQSATLNMSKEELDAVCAASGAWGEYAQGRKTWSMDASGLMRLATGDDEAENYTFNDAFTDFNRPELINIEWQIGTAATGGFRYFGTVFYTGLTFDWGTDATTFSQTLRGTGPISRAAVVPITPATPTDPVTDDVAKTFDWDYTPGYEEIFEYEQTLNGGTLWTDLSSKPLIVPGAKAAGQVGVRVKSIAGDNPSNPLYNAVAFT